MAWGIILVDSRQVSPNLLSRLFSLLQNFYRYLIDLSWKVEDGYHGIGLPT